MLFVFSFQLQVGLEGSSAGQWWLDMIGTTLDEGSTFERVGSRQLAGLLIAMWSVYMDYDKNMKLGLSVFIINGCLYGWIKLNNFVVINHISSC